MIKVALTGGIATGKSHVLRHLRDRGIPALDADDLVHDGMRPETSITQAIALEFGTGVLNSDGSVDRALLGAKVFADPDARLRLEAIVHPSVYETICKWFEAANGTIGVVSIPLLYETHHETDFDVVVVTVCKPEQQLQRIMERGLSEEEARLRMAAQIPTEDKALRADYVISTSGSTSETDAQVDDLLIELAKRARIP